MYPRPSLPPILDSRDAAAYFRHALIAVIVFESELDFSLGQCDFELDSKRRHYTCFAKLRVPNPRLMYQRLTGRSTTTV